MPSHDENESINVTHILAKSIRWLMRYCLSHIFAILVTAEAAILDGHFEKNERSFVTHYWSKFIQRFLRTVIFMFLLLLVTTANGHLGLPGHINLKGPSIDKSF